MSNKNQQNSKPDTIFPIKINKLEQAILDHYQGNLDLNFTQYRHQGKNIAVLYISYIVDTDKLQNSILQPLLKRKRSWTNQLILSDIPLSEGTSSTTLEDILEKLINGNVFIYIEDQTEIISYPLLKMEQRSLGKAETESLVLGPQVAFTESLSANMNVVRGIMRTYDLVFEKITLGKRIPYEVRVVYLKSLANETDIETMRQRVRGLDVDEIGDVAILKQYIEDSSTNIFPQFYATELPDRFCYSITKGKIGLLGDNSPQGIIAPSTFFSFFESPEDLYMRWGAGSFLRILRFLAMFVAITITPIYVAIVTYQFELLPTKLLVTIGQSRAQVPFPPIIEALLIEFFIELLREAGARLPTKVASTMGIVGGLVIGEAAVQAGLTSNILIIVVAMSALASFTAPSYLMGTSLRVIRFPLMLLAALWGLIGIMFGICLIIIHLLRLTSLGRPYLAPLYPLQFKDFNKVFYRSPFSNHSKRARIIQAQDKSHYSKKDAEKKRDIDE